MRPSREHFYYFHDYESLIDWGNCPRIRNPQKPVKFIRYKKDPKTGCRSPRHLTASRYQVFVYKWRERYRWISDNIRQVKRDLKQSHREWCYDPEERAWRAMAGIRPGTQKPEHYEIQLRDLKAKIRYMLLLRHHLRNQAKLDLLNEQSVRKDEVSPDAPCTPTGCVEGDD